MSNGRPHTLLRSRIHFKRDTDIPQAITLHYGILQLCSLQFIWVLWLFFASVDLVPYNDTAVLLSISNFHFSEFCCGWRGNDFYPHCLGLTLLLQSLWLPIHAQHEKLPHLFPTLLMMMMMMMMMTMMMIMIIIIIIIIILKKLNRIISTIAMSF